MILSKDPFSIHGQFTDCSRSWQPQTDCLLRPKTPSLRLRTALLDGAQTAAPPPMPGLGNPKNHGRPQIWTTPSMGGPDGSSFVRDQLGRRKLGSFAPTPLPNTSPAPLQTARLVPQNRDWFGSRPLHRIRVGRVWVGGELGVSDPQAEQKSAPWKVDDRQVGRGSKGLRSVPSVPLVSSTIVTPT